MSLLTQKVYGWTKRSCHLHKKGTVEPFSWKTCAQLLRLVDSCVVVVSVVLTFFKSFLFGLNPVGTALLCKINQALSIISNVSVWFCVCSIFNNAQRFFNQCSVVLFLLKIQLKSTRTRLTFHKEFEKKKKNLILVKTMWLKSLFKKNGSINPHSPAQSDRSMKRRVERLLLFFFSFLRKV